jgi:hypothetical protein
MTPRPLTLHEQTRAAGRVLEATLTAAMMLGAAVGLYWLAVRTVPDFVVSVLRPTGYVVAAQREVDRVVGR